MKEFKPIEFVSLIDQVYGRVRSELYTDYPNIHLISRASYCERYDVCACWGQGVPKDSPLLFFCRWNDGPKPAKED